ncbi:hypothetical protein ACFX13_006882 [Malus domestica]
MKISSLKDPSFPKLSIIASSSDRKRSILVTGNSRPQPHAYATSCYVTATTTPLSWNRSTGSPSATTDSFEESSCPRSKGNAAYESTSTTTDT